MKAAYGVSLGVFQNGGGSSPSLYRGERESAKNAGPQSYWHCQQRRFLTHPRRTLRSKLNVGMPASAVTDDTAPQFPLHDGAVTATSPARRKPLHFSATVAVDRIRAPANTRIPTRKPHLTLPPGAQTPAPTLHRQRPSQTAATACHRAARASHAFRTWRAVQYALVQHPASQM
jgi:hypothetical protein